MAASPLVQMAAVILQEGLRWVLFDEQLHERRDQEKLSPALLELLKGKTCFHVKTLDDGLRKDIQSALGLGTKVYRERGWL
jgi:hypothetical protein